MYFKKKFNLNLTNFSKLNTCVITFKFNKKMIQEGDFVIFKKAELMKIFPVKRDK